MGVYDNIDNILDAAQLAMDEQGEQGRTEQPAGPVLTPTTQLGTSKAQAVVPTSAPTTTTPTVEQTGTTKGQMTGGVGTPAGGTIGTTVTQADDDSSGTVTTPEGTATTPEPAKTYLADWGKDGLGAFNSGAFSIQDGIRDYGQWAQDNGQQPLDYLTLVSLMQNKDITKSVKENEKTQRNQELQEKWERTGNLLTHLGNFIGASAFGAPDQKHEDIVELKGRQKKISDAIEAKRDAYNQNYLKAYQMDVERRNKEAQQKAAEEQKKFENNLKERAQATAEQKQQAAEQWHKDKQELERMKLDIRKEENEIKREKMIKDYNAKVAAINANAAKAGMSYTTEFEYDSDGNRVKSTKTPVGSGTQQRTAENGGGRTPPSRRSGNQASRTPPSRR